MIVTIDTGATKTLVTSFGKDGVMRETTKFPTPHDPDEYIAALKKVLKEKFESKKVDAIVLATPGMIDKGVVIWGGGNLSNWQNFNIKARLRGILDNAPIYIDNDASLAGLGEARMLKLNVPQVLYVTISTGIGTGIITDGHLNYALRNSEAGHALIEFDGVVREWETFASGKAIYNTYGKYARDITSKRIWYQIADRISRGFLAVIPILQPDVIVIGGSMGTYFDRYDDQLLKILKEKLPGQIPCPKFVQAKYAELAVIYGCYYYAIDELSNKKA